MWPLPRLIYAGWRLAAGRARRDFDRALATPQATQEQLLSAILAANRTSEVGRRWRFETIRDAATYRERVPLSRWVDIAPAVDAIRGGASGVLTTEPVTRLVPTSGSGGAVKLVPWTAGLGRGFQAAIGPWIDDLLRRRPAVADGPAYWSLSPAFAVDERTSTVPIGFDNDATYLGAWLEPLVQQILLAPTGLRHAESLVGFQYATLLLLLAAADLALVSVWHPSFFTLLWNARVGWWDRLVDDVARGTCHLPQPVGAAAERAVARRLRPRPQRAAQLRALGPGASVAEVWPELAVISAWGDGPASAPARVLAQLVAPAQLERKGLLATEACVSVPYQGLMPLALTAHYFEFLDDHERCFESHELAVGGCYEVVVTTQGGLYRYRLGDLVEVDGRLGATPSLRFLGRADTVVDQVGEKLDEPHVAAALASALDGEPAGAFAVLAASPVATTDSFPGYTLLVDEQVTDPGRVASRLVEVLRHNPHFAYACDLGQLESLRVFVVAGDAHAVWLNFEATGRLLGGVKPRALCPRSDWSGRLVGRYVNL